MKKTIMLFLLAGFFACSLYAQNRDRSKADQYLTQKGEVCFQFTAQNETQLREIASFLSFGHKPIDRETLRVKAYANAATFNQFLTYNLDYEILTEDNEFNPHANISDAAQAQWDTQWNLYPTYSQYVAKMQSFVTDYPNLCSLQSIGTTPNGRELYVLKISDNVAIKEAEPEFFYSSSMHGDELAGYPLMIRFIDHLLSNYATDSEIADIVNSTEIYINPLANPDGSYGAPGSDIISNPTRTNSSGQDLNRNYPDNIGGIHNNAINGDYEAETEFFMNFQASRNFVLVANLHGGTELVNYPYDNTTTQHADHDYYERISVIYATNAQNASDALGDTTYMTVDEDAHIYPSPGVTNGVQWFLVYGGRQDYTNFYLHSKEVTLELSDIKFLPASELPNHWEYNRQAFLDYIKQANYGFQGKITDASGNPIVAQISIAGHDKLNSYVFSFEEHGDYYRLIDGGTYNVTYEAPGYETQTISVTVTDNAKTVQDVTMIATTSLPVANGTELCDSGSAMLSASGNGVLNWYTSIDGDTPVATGTSYNTPTLTSTTTYYVEDVISKADVGITDSASNGSQFTNVAQYLIFDCTESVMLDEVTINSNQAGELEIQLQDSSGNMLDSRIIILPTAGIQSVDLDFILPVANNLRLAIKELSSGLTVYRTNSGVNYPYSNGSVSIKNSSAGLDFYYFFYNWKMNSIRSARKEVTVTVNPSPTPDYTFQVNSSDNGEVTFTNTSTNATSYSWDFGDGNMSTDENPTHTYVVSGNYTVTLTATNAACGDNITSEMVNVTVIPLSVTDELLTNVNIYPNPVEDKLYIDTDHHSLQNIVIYNLLGEQILQRSISENNSQIALDLQQVKQGVYMIKLDFTEGNLIKKIIIK
ncbi:M14 family zinc carboxypeptidase [Kordia sp.]|uniref:M14 family zinc carboxypeptidase n=1 Tax=Kordia sp. TaxID=1965332 RepID=UPI003B5B4EEC